MTFWETFLAALGGGGVLVVLVAFFGKALVSQLLQKDFELHKRRLEDQSNRDLAEFQSALDRAAAEHSVAFSGWHKKVMEQIAHAYGHVLETSTAIERYVVTVDRSNAVHFREAYSSKGAKILLREVDNAATEGAAYLRRNGLWFERDLFVPLYSFFDRMRAITMELSLASFGVDLSDERTTEMHRKWRETALQGQEQAAKVADLEQLLRSAMKAERDRLTESRLTGEVGNG